MRRLSRRTRIRLLTVLCALLSLPVLAGIVSDLKAHKRRAARDERLNATEHQHEPLRRADLDRG
jgi:hypothetical protein